jgi:hypothetical protein
MSALVRNDYIVLHPLEEDKYPETEGLLSVLAEAMQQCGETR